MSAGTSEFFCLICLLLCSCTALEKIIRAKLGQDVILPCKVPNININTVVEWNGPGLDPDFVLFNQSGRFDPDNYHPSYQDRVDLQDKEMKDGNFSLILKNVTMEDNGIYECRVFEKGIKTPISYIRLVVLPPALEITAELGQDVILPCKVPNDITLVGWNGPVLHPLIVLLSRDDPENQQLSYKNRVDLQDKEMKDGNFSLILKDVKMEDRGTYECSAFQERQAVLISIINLEVQDDSWKTIVGVVVPLVVIILSAVGFAVYKILQIRKRKKEKKEKQEEIEQETQKNEFLESRLKELEPTAEHVPE